jgi:glucosamine kinase
MKFVVESGSTKANWALVNNEGTIVATYDTMGFNPFFHHSDFIGEHIRKNKKLVELAPQIDTVFFYGSGCSSDHFKQIVVQGLIRVFDQAAVYVDHDLIAAAYATYTGEPCISCIIGTGSNSCYFDGKNLTEEVPALAYILGDEGSGSYFGKRLLVDYLYKKLAPGIREDLEATYPLSEAIVFENVYQKPFANVYLAGFTPFIYKHRSEPYFAKMIEDGLALFLENHVCCYPNFREVPTHFVGSVAYYFSDTLKRAAERLNITVGTIIRQPIERLVAYHLNYLFVKQDV